MSGFELAGVLAREGRKGKEKSRLEGQAQSRAATEAPGAGNPLAPHLVDIREVPIAIVGMILCALRRKRQKEKDIATNCRRCLKIS